MDTEKQNIKIEFNRDEINILRAEAIIARAKLLVAGLHPKRVYEEERLEFVTEYMRGAFTVLNKKQSNWMKRIKNEVRMVHTA